MQKYLIKNISVVNEGTISVRDVLMENGRISRIDDRTPTPAGAVVIDGTGKHLLPGAIDDQVHFREPGLTHKANIATESRAAVAGGVTSFMEMPNTKPAALTLDLLEDKYAIAAATSAANYSFFMGTSNDNIDEVLRVNDHRRDICGVKVFMGSSTGNMLVDNLLSLERLFRESEVLIATHCEDERIIKTNLARIKAEKSRLEPSDHPIIRDVDACFESSFMAVQIAKRYNTRLHILHISTARELQLFSNMLPLAEKRITCEVCVHHLHFTADDYATLGNRIKCNPAIKSPENRAGLWQALLDDTIDVIATDHAPHTREEKSEDYEHAHAGLPLVQHSLPLMLHYHREGRISLEHIVQKMSHDVATCFQIRERGFIREGYHADLVIVDLDRPFTVTTDNILYKCGWSPLEGTTFPASVTHTFVNGQLVFEQGRIHEDIRGQRMQFDR
ncbi:MAG: dihydroorotase [Chitinophagaceae bacterium]|nr:dihydroorotase [Chitinophagaceae bacterium]